MSTVEEIVEAIKDLSPGERDEVLRRMVSLWQRELINEPKKNDSAMYRLPIKRARPRRPPIHIKGKPISETIIEDRR